MSTGPGSGYHVKFFKNSPSDEIGYLFAFDDSTYMEHSTSFVVQLTFGDKVGVACTGTGPSSILGASNGKHHEYNSHFSGFKINDAWLSKIFCLVVKRQTGVGYCRFTDDNVIGSKYHRESTSLVVLAASSWVINGHRWLSMTAHCHMWCHFHIYPRTQIPAVYLYLFSFIHLI